MLEGVLDYSNLYPSFPTGGIIINKDDIHTIHETGKGKVILRGKVEIKDNKILITELPYQVYAQPYVEKVTDMAVKDEITGIEAVYNRSGKNKLLIEIECDGNPDHVLKQLYNKTDLQKNYNANQWALVGKTPKLLTLKDYIDIYIKHNLECLSRELNFDLNKAKVRLHIVEGLLIAQADIDNIIKIIKESHSPKDAAAALIKKYKLSEEQTKAILNMKLSSLSKLEVDELLNEKKELLSTIDKLTSIIDDDFKKKTIISERLMTLVKQYGDERRTELVQIDTKSEDKEIAEVTPEDVVVIATQNGDIKRVAANKFKTQRRNGKGVKSESDAILSMISTNTVDNLLLFTNKGKMYKLLVDNIPEGTNVSKGDRIANLINLEPDEKVMAITSLDRKIDKKYVIFITKNGLFKKSNLDEYTSTRKSTGIAAIKLKEGDSIANVTFANEEDFVIITKEGMSIRFETADIAPIGRNTSGVKSIKLNENDEVLVGLPIENEKDELIIVSSCGFGKRIALSETIVQGRGGKGIYIYKPNEVNGNVAGAVLANKDNNILVVGKPNSICVSVMDLPLLSRISAGNIVIKSSQVNSIIKI